MAIKTVLFTFLVVVAARLCLIENFAVALPFWDQWDAEGDFLLRTWIQGTLRFSDLWQPHNEHRIFPTRLLSLLIFIVTGTWNNLVEARVNTVLAAVVPMLLTGFLARQGSLTGLRWAVVPVIVAQFALPFAFENILVGFQSQFYFLLIFTVTSLALAALYPDRWWAVLLMIVLCALSILTMASGLLTPLAVAAVYGLRLLHDRQFYRSYAAIIITLLVLGILGYLIIPDIAANHGYRAQGAADFRKALKVMFSWPARNPSLVWVLLWLPAVLAVATLVWTRRLSPADTLMAGCVIWSLAQAFAIAYGRGHWLSSLSSRYTELFSPGLIGNAWFAVRLVELWAGSRLRWAALLFFVPFIIGHVSRYRFDIKDTREIYKRSLLQEQNVARYLKTGDPAALDQPTYEIPYPHADRLQHLLDDPTLRSILPPIPQD